MQARLLGGARRSLALFLMVAIVGLISWVQPAGAQEVTTDTESDASLEATASGGQAGTTLSAEKTAQGFREKTITYDWTVEKSVTPQELNLGQGESGTVNYTINATRTQASEAEVTGVRGEICVTNGGAVPTENLELVDQVEFKTGAGQFGPLAGATQTITPAQLAPGESKCYPYEITFQPVPDAQYRNSVKVTITNHSGHLGEEFGPEPKADFSLPNQPTVKEIDESATVSDSQICHQGFTCNPSSPGPWNFSGSGSVTFPVVVTNFSAPCDEHFNLANTVTLTENDSSETHTSSANVAIYTKECPKGCTLTIGYWKTHAGFTGNNADRVSQYLPESLGTAGGTKTVTVVNATQAVQYLNFNGDASNGINKLYAQLLGAKLNIANGADGSAVNATIAAADSFLATKNAGDWSSLTKAQKQQVISWATALDNYNNGVTGPGHCG
jgi:hypothetical protein